MAKLSVIDEVIAARGSSATLGDRVGGIIKTSAHTLSWSAESGAKDTGQLTFEPTYVIGFWQKTGGGNANDVALSWGIASLTDVVGMGFSTNTGADSTEISTSRDTDAIGGESTRVQFGGVKESDFGGVEFSVTNFTKAAPGIEVTG